jgi:hypothetical protein
MPVRLLDDQITAINLLPDFLGVLKGRGENAGVAGRISTLLCSMDSLPFYKEA